ncbi:acyl-CoA thioesterase [bacterium]|nr:acyl-CoA thioesterase [bacterium]
MRWNTTTRFPVEVQFEDIDGGGVVHHPNYLKYLERARCHAMREIGVPFEACLKNGIAFVIAEFNAKYLAPLQLGAKVVVETRLVAVRKSSLKVYQKIVVSPGASESDASHTAFLKPDKETFFIAQLRLVTVDLKTGKPVSLPDDLRVAGGIPSADSSVHQPSWSDVRLTSFSEA